MSRLKLRSLGGNWHRLLLLRHPAFRVGFGRQIAFGGSEPGRVCHTRFWQHPGALHPPSLFTCDFVWVDATPGATPEKRVLAASGDTDNRHRWPTHAAGRPQVPPGASLPGGVAIRGVYPRRLRAPCFGGVVPPCGDTPIQACLWSAIDEIMCQKRFCGVFGSIGLHKQACMGASPHGGTTPPNRVPGVYGDRRRGWPPHRAGSPPGIPGARLQRGWAIGAGCPCLRGPAERVFRGLRPPIQNFM